MERPFKRVKFITLDLLLVVVLLLVAGAVLIPWGFADKEEAEEVQLYHKSRILIKFTGERPPEDVIKAWGGQIDRGWSEIDVYSANMPAGVGISQAVESILALTGVDAVEPDFLTLAADSPSPARTGGRWGLDRINSRQAWEYTQGREEVVIAVLDTGLDREHSLFSGRVLEGFSSLEADLSDKPAYFDDHGRGTHMAALAAGGEPERMTGVAGNCRLLPIKTHGSDGRSFRADLIDGLFWLGQWARENPDKKVIGLLGEGSRFYSHALELAVDFAIEQGVLLVSGTGDIGSGELFYPAAFEGVMAVAAVDPQDQIAEFSNYGTGVDIAAPGTDIFAATTGGGYAYYDGTAPAAAYVAGAAALLWSLNMELSPEEIKDILKKSSRSIEDIEIGILDVLGAVKLIADN